MKSNAAVDTTPINSNFVPQIGNSVSFQQETVTAEADSRINNKGSATRNGCLPKDRPFGKIVAITAAWDGAAIRWNLSD